MNARVLIVDDDAALLRALADRFEFWGHDVTTAADGRSAWRRWEHDDAFDLILLDLAMPEMSGLEVLEKIREREGGGDEHAEIIVLTAQLSIETVVEAMKRGADDFFPKPADFELLEQVVNRVLEKRRLRRVNRIMTTQSAHGMVAGESPRMSELLETATRAAQADTTVLLTGESGTGKQLLAEHIHRKSPRRGESFLYLNCVAIPDELIESELFGHEKGAFTGAARQQSGRLEDAAGGTVFLDEIGDISDKLQLKLLHFLETGKLERIGGRRTIEVDSRIIAATNRDLPTAVGDGKFRADLYYRLNVIRLDIPALRERREDIPELANAFLGRFQRELGREGLEFAPETRAMLEAYQWPGNIRQLKNAVERMVVLATGRTLSPELLPPEIRFDGSLSVESPFDGTEYKESVAQFKRRLITGALQRAGGNQTRAAELLGLQRTYLNRLIKELGVPY
jgi:DNA-binding NtrC family response regulator